MSAAAAFVAALAIAPARGQPQPAAEKPAREMLVDVTLLAVLEPPNTAAPVIARLPRDTVVYEVRRLEQWVEFRRAKERLGWVQAASLRLPSVDAARPSSGVGAALSVAAIAALIVNESRRAYYAEGHRQLP